MLCCLPGGGGGYPISWCHACKWVGCFIRPRCSDKHVCQHSSHVSLWKFGCCSQGTCKLASTCTCMLVSCKCNHVIVHASMMLQVADDIKRLSKVKPKLPWSAADKVKKAKPAAKAGAKPTGFGKKR